jgi:hypothetical protein
MLRNCWLKWMAWTSVFQQYLKGEMANITFHTLMNPMYRHSYRPEEVHSGEYNSITATLFSKKCICKELLCQSAYTVINKTIAFLLLYFVSSNHFEYQNIKSNKVNLNISIKFTSEINIFTFSVTHQLFFLHKYWILWPIFDQNPGSTSPSDIWNYCITKWLM